jgi:hypothetical protein
MQKVRQGQMLRRWCELCKIVRIYGYNYNMLVSGLTPVPEFTKLRRDFPLMKKWGVMGFPDESRNVWAEAGIASLYLRIRPGHSNVIVLRVDTSLSAAQAAEGMQSRALLYAPRPH